mmetsp:Transcript_12637/g.27568  ORF Transcript_12637/g.27568 Transcript_12637/m.27568 type:complete len:118 (-) Transcript_12637:137-490(-)
MSAVEYTVNENFSTRSFGAGNEGDKRKGAGKSASSMGKSSMAKITSAILGCGSSSHSSKNRGAMVAKKDEDDEDLFVAVTSRVSLAVDEYVDFIVPKKSKRRASRTRPLRKFMAKFT